MPLGRPSSFTAEIGDKICQRIADGDSLRLVLREEGIDRHTVWRWLAASEDFRSQYMVAQQERAERYAESIVDIADAEPALDAMGKIDPGWVAQQRLRVDARKWVASKVLPKKYGDRVLNELSGPDGTPIRVITGVPLPPALPAPSVE